MAGNENWAKESGFELACLRRLQALQTLLETTPLLFHNRQFDIERLVELHKAINVSCEAINTILHDGELFVHFLAEITELKIDNVESPIDLRESPVRLSKSGSNKPFERREPLIDGSSCLGRFRLCHLSN